MDLRRQFLTNFILILFYNNHYFDHFLFYIIVFMGSSDSKADQKIE